jgi:predicted nucleic acid-binding protein
VILIVADASALVEYLLGSKAGSKVAATIEARAVDLHVPALCDVEVASALRGLARSRRVDRTRALEVLADYVDLPLVRHGHVPLLARVFELRDNFSAYDATYLALADSLGARLVTCDKAFAR